MAAPKRPIPATLKPGINAFVTQLRKEGKSPATLGAYQNDLEQFARFAEKQGITSWVSVTPQLLNRFAESLAAQEFSVSSQARKTAAMRSFFAFLSGRGLISNPATRLPHVRVRLAKPQTVPPNTVALLLETPNRGTPTGSRDRAMFTLLYSTGMHATELVSLDVPDVDLESGVVTCTGYARRRREVKLDEETAAALAAYLSSGRETLLSGRNESALFLNHRGERLSRQGLWVLLQDYVARAGITSPVTLRGLRHSAAASMLRAGMNLRHVQTNLGHSRLFTTESRYGHRHTAHQ